ncbi:MAG: hypothetical protein U0869_11715 [Chloroflexota bacterium]
MTVSDPVAKDPTPALATDQPLYEVPFLTLLGLAQNAAAHPRRASTPSGCRWSWATSRRASRRASSRPT